MPMNDTQDILMNAVSALASVCDGARSEDGMGFNGTDTLFGKSLSQQPSWSPLQRRLAWEMLRKYTKQLQGFGIQYSEIPEPIDPRTSDGPKVRGEKNGEKVRINNRTVSLGKEPKTGKDAFAIRFRWDEGLLAAVKEVSGRLFNGDNPSDKFWTVPFSMLTQLKNFIEKYEFTVNADAEAKIKELVATAQKNIEASQSQKAEISIPGLSGTLRPFQAAGVQYARAAKRVLIADDMGLGKTIQALATVEAENAYPVVIVCPATLKHNWQRELNKWLPNRTTVILGGRKNSDFPQVDFIIINYDVLSYWVQTLRRANPKAVIFDESHYLKSHTAARTAAAVLFTTGYNAKTKRREYLNKLPYVLCLTGTPILNRPNELISPLMIMDRLRDMGGFQHFANHFCAADENKYGSPMGAKNLEELATNLRATCMIRRTKAEVLKELPAKERATVTLRIDNRETYNHAANNLYGWLLENEGRDAANRASHAEQLVAIEKLKQIAVDGKFAAAVEWAESFLETDEKLIFFATHIDVQHRLLEKFPNAAHVLAEDSLEEREANIHRFQTDPKCNLIICSLKAGGIGITLTAASNVAFLELGWNPADMEQAEDRPHRIGQQNQVTAWYLVDDETIDGDILNLIEKKRKVVTGATGVGDASILGELIKRLKEKK